MLRTVILILLIGSNSVFAQNRSTIINKTRNPNRTAEVKTIVYVELLVGRSGVGLTAQKWSRVFKNEKIPFQIRRGRTRDQIENKELNRGPLRKVTLIGKIEPNGTLIFDGRKFRLGESEKLADWIDEVKKYGAQGSPKGKQLWGLNEDQFNEVFQVLAEPLDKNIKGLSFTKSLRSFNLPSSISHFVSQDAKEWLLDHELVSEGMPQELKGISKGSALAAMLRAYGLAGYPLRMSNGTVRFQIEPIKDGVIYWPIGWEPKKSNVDTAPTLYRFEREELKGEIATSNVLNAVSAKSGVPIVLDHYYMRIHDIDLTQEMYKHKTRKMALMSLIKRLTGPHFLNADLKVDERGRPLVWVECLKARRKPKKSFR